jgi:3-oxoacyl-[acyl-carrier protein] reductase
MKNSIIIGGSRGSGFVISETLKKRGDNIAVLSRTNHNSQIEHVSFDLLDVNVESNCKSIIDKMTPIDNLIFCQKNRTDVESYNYEFDLNVHAVKKVIDSFQDNFSDSASIVAIGSPAGQTIVSEQPLAYHASKAALEQLVRYYAVKLGPKGVRVNCLLPGTLIKKENKEFYENEENLKDLFKKIIPLARQGTSKDLAEAVNFLCSQKSSFITGQIIYVDGGISLHGQESLARTISQI